MGPAEKRLRQRWLAPGAVPLGLVGDYPGVQEAADELKVSRRLMAVVNHQAEFSGCTEDFAFVTF